MRENKVRESGSRGREKTRGSASKKNKVRENKVRKIRCGNHRFLMFYYKNTEHTLKIFSARFARRGCGKPRVGSQKNKVRKIRCGKYKVRKSNLAARIFEGTEPYFRERPVHISLLHDYQ